MTDLIRKHPVIKKTTAADCLLYLGYLFFIWIDPYFYCPVYLSHPDSLYTDGLFQQVLYFKDFFCSLWHLIVQHLSAIFHNQNQTKTLNENYYLNSLCTLTYCLFRPSKFQEHIVLFHYNIFIVSEQVFLWFFMNFYAFEQICSNVQFIPSPIGRHWKSGKFSITGRQICAKMFLDNKILLK